MEMLHEAQEELKNLRNKTLPLSTPRRFHSLGLFPMVGKKAKGQRQRGSLKRKKHLYPSTCLSLFQDSLAAEIEGTMRKELQMDDPDVEEQR